ncbi:MAG: hypothetical protein Q9172_000592 [Xanthocarpia lactea]
MHINNHARHLAFALSLFPFFGLSTTKVVETTATPLVPININEIEALTGVQRRAAVDFSRLDPSTQAQLIYGRPGNDGQLLLANMTLYAPDGLQIVLMERFEPLTSAVDCKGDDGEMSLTFQSQEVLDYAVNTWSFINQAKDESFLLIANHDGCGPDEERQAYRITNIREDRAKLTTYLTAQPASWSEIAGTFDVDFQAAAMAQPGRRRRGLGDFFDGVTDFFGGVTDFVANGDIDFDKAANFPVNIGTPGERHSIVNLSKFSLACTDCYVTGSFQMTGRLSVSDFKLQDFTLTGSPQDFAAKLELETNITAPLGSPETLQYSKELFSAPIPSAGIAVTGIFSVGAVISYEVGVSTSFSGSASMTFGVAASLPNTAAVVADFRHPDQSSATGFDGGKFDPSFDINALSADVTVAAFAQPKLSFGIDILKVGHLEIALGVKSPVVSATLTGGYNESGLCSSEAGASKTGVELASEVAVDINLALEASLGSETQAPPLSLTLFKLAYPLLSKCFPLALPGFSPVAGNGTAPSANTTPPVPPFANATNTATSVAVTELPLNTLLPITTNATTAPVTTTTTTPPVTTPTDTKAGPKVPFGKRPRKGTKLRETEK